MSKLRDLLKSIFYHSENKSLNLTSKILPIFILVLFLGGINAVIDNVSWRIDLTKDNRYTLSDYSKALVKDLDDIISLQLYMSKKLPPQIQTIKQQIVDLLYEYRAVSNDKIQVEVISKEADQLLNVKLQQLGIPKFRMNIVEKDKLQVVEGFMGLVVMYEDKKEVIPVVVKMDTLEYDVSLLIRKITASTIPKVVVMVSDPEAYSKNYKTIEKELRQQYQVRVISFTDPIPDGSTTLIIQKPSNLSPSQAFRVDQFVVGGGKLVLAMDGVDVQMDKGAVLPLESGLSGVLSTYGVKIEPNLVLDRSMSYASFSSGYMNFTLPYPYWPKLLKQNYLGDHPIVNKLESLVFPWPSSITYTNPNSDTIEIQTLLSTTEQSWTIKENFNLNPRQQMRPTQATSSHVVASILQGQFKAHFTTPPSANLSIENTEGESSLVIFANSQFFEDNKNAQFPNNRTLFLNAVDWVTLDSGELGIPSRFNLESPIRESSASTRGFVKWVATLLLPILIAFIGLGRLLIIKKSRQLFYEKQ